MYVKRKRQLKHSRVVTEESQVQLSTRSASPRYPEASDILSLSFPAPLLLAHGPLALLLSLALLAQSPLHYSRSLLGLERWLSG